MFSVLSLNNHVLVEQDNLIATWPFPNVLAFNPSSVSTGSVSVKLEWNAVTELYLTLNPGLDSGI